MDALRRSARISKLDRKTNEYIRGKMDAQDMILDDITWKQLVWYGHVERMDTARLPKIYDSLETWRKETTRPSPENLERWNIYSSEWKRSKNGRMEQSKAIEYESRKASSDILKPHNTYTGCVSESGDFVTLFFLVRQHWGGCRYRHFAASFKAF
jgi:hypothetical protein